MDGIAQRILDGVNGSFSLAGLSMGGYVAFEVMRRTSTGRPAGPARHGCARRHAGADDPASGPD